MKKNVLFLLLFVLSVLIGQAQVAINETGNDPEASAMLDVSSNSKGILIPRLTTTARTAIASPANGLLVYDTNFSSFWYYNQTRGYWIELKSDLAIYLKDLEDVKTDENSIFVGNDSGKNDDGENWNTALGIQSLKNNTSGMSNAVLGYAAMADNESGKENTAMGSAALATNTTGNSNVGVGYTALGMNIGGSENVAIGNKSLLMASSGNQNTAIGSGAGQNSQTTASGNVFIGYNAGKNEDGNNKLYIENSDSSMPLIGGDFSTDKVDVNADLKVSKELLVVQDLTANTNLLVNTDVSVGRNLEVGKRLTVSDSLILRNALQIAGGADGKVLTSDADGNASWQEAAAGGASELNDLTDARTTATGIHLGKLAGSSMTGNYNITLGNSAMQNNSEGYNNIAIGVLAGYSQNPVSTSGNIIIGNRVGIDNELDNQLIIDNGESESPLIQGDFNAKSLKINGTLSVTGGNPAEGKVLTSDADGNASWEEVPVTVSSLTDLSDAKNDASSLFLGSNPGADDGENKNTAVGISALTRNTSGQNNVAYGHSSLLSNTTGTDNSAFGTGSLELNTSGNQNTAVGSAALYNAGSGSNNTALGFEAGFGSFGSNASGNVFIGNKAGYNETESNKLYIDNSETESPLIYGDFEENKAKINGDLEVANHALINGDLTATEFYYQSNRTAIYSIPPAAFMFQRIEDGPEQAEFNNLGTIWILSTNYQWAARVLAPVYLPQGATIKQVKALLHVDSPSSYNVELLKQEFTSLGDSWTVVNIASENVEINDYFNLAQSDIVTDIVDNTRYSYYISIEFFPPDFTVGSMAGMGAQIIYEYNSLNH